ncbi:MAG: hypothetical protein OEO20_11330 [Gemmatimonadota bacterium]|nr:hypothetical protein [Gemmatimonadota bacterium]MDH3291593.1 hypothetical protein [Gemmatimonadota bacterium]MDH3366496.1 hypothetical protein [Gemmatimonadota bacterium]MDH3478885.1 hypothetical protein [Gemmatimonadota bacterium]MDH3571209.1 hypothetical protein [Gemmatimonadota bacterium]
MMHADLLYHTGKQMNPEPINIELRELVRVLARGEPAVVKLEPGDASHYAFLIVPASANHVRHHLGRYGIESSRAVDYWFVARLDDHGGAWTWLPIDWPARPELMILANDNEWTVTLLVWWFEIVAVELEAERGGARAQSER